ncbi:MAG: hypothetical protein E7573_09905 [Ruminococcaceae bacterium]|nr:hypothetical protein [Oscillospiraceae bacterium]
MYKISVPVMDENVTRCTPVKVYEEIRKFEPDRIFLALDRYENDIYKREIVLKSLSENCKFFKSKGYEVGAWIWAFMMNDSPFTCMTSLKGQKFSENMCPADDDFIDFAASYVEDIAKTGVDIIMYDDDLRYGFLGNAPGCVCKHHLKLISEIVGENVTAELINEKVHSGMGNKYRDAYIKANGKALKNFAVRMRQAVDKVDPSIRLGACSCLNSWDIDGVTAEELSLIFAGKTKPFFRLIGAPYWAALNAWGNSLQDSVELSRMECSWVKDRNMEIFSEGDVYPRPRTLVPAAYLEGFDTALRAAGCTDGILKYGMDYVSDASYETGYAAYHIRNRELYKDIEKYFSDKKSVGVRVYEAPQKLSQAHFREEISIDNMFFSLCARTLSYNTIPTVYEGQGVCGAVFGENARHLPVNALEKGLIVDISAAEILSENGIDTGVQCFGEKTEAGKYEIFTDTNNRISAMSCPIRDIRLKDGVQLLSFTEKDGVKIPMSFLYENNQGQRFLVLNVIPDINNPNVLRHYERNRQYTQSVYWLSGEKLPAACHGHPALYMQCKKNENAMSVGLWNFFADEIFSPEIVLDKKYSTVSFINCSGELSEDKIILSHIPAFGFAGFCVVK